MSIKKKNRRAPKRWRGISESTDGRQRGNRIPQVRGFGSGRPPLAPYGLPRHRSLGQWKYRHDLWQSIGLRATSGCAGNDTRQGFPVCPRGRVPRNVRHRAQSIRARALPRDPHLSSSPNRSCRQLRARSPAELCQNPNAAPGGAVHRLRRRDERIRSRTQWTFERLRQNRRAREVQCARTDHQCCRNKEYVTVAVPHISFHLVTE